MCPKPTPKVGDLVRRLPFSAPLDDEDWGLVLASQATHSLFFSCSEDSRGPTRDFHILFVPRRSLLCEQRLKDLGVLGSFIHREEYSLDLIPFDGDLLSMESEGTFKVSPIVASLLPL